MAAVTLRHCDVERSRVLEWSAALTTWSVLDPAGHIDDPALDAPLPIEALVGTARADDAVARALLLRRNPVLVQKLAERRAEGIAEGKAKGRAEGIAEALITVLTARGVVLDDVDRTRLLGERDPGRLDRWIARATTCETLAELDDEPGVWPEADPRVAKSLR